MRWADLDQLGHVNNVVYVDYLQEARVDMLRVLGRGPDTLTEGLVVVRHEVTYLLPLLFDFRPVSIECWVVDVRPATFTMAYEVFREEADGERSVYLRAATVLTPFVFASERPRRITPAEHEMLEGYLEQESRARHRPVPLPEDARRRFDVHVRFSDVDVYGHVNNVKYFEFLQESRIALFADLTEGTRDWNVVVAQTDVDYRRPILFRVEPYDCRSVVTRVGSRSLTVESEIADGPDADAEILARARVVLVFYDLETGRSMEPRPEVRERLLSALPGSGATGSPGLDAISTAGHEVRGDREGTERGFS